MEHWFKTEQGILTHHRQLRDHALEDYERVLRRIAADEEAMISIVREQNANPAHKGYLQTVGVAIGDCLEYDVIGVRKDGSFRSVLKSFGFDKDKIDRVIDDLDMDRDVTIIHQGTRFALRAL